MFKDLYNKYGYRWLAAWPALIDKILVICSLGIVYPDLEMKFLVWNTKRIIKKKRANDHTKNG